MRGIILGSKDQPIASHPNRLADFANNFELEK